jgi:competence protein ComEA
MSGRSPTSPDASAGQSRIREAKGLPAETIPTRQPTAPRGQLAPDPEARLGLRNGDRRVVTLLMSISVLLMIWHWYRLTQSRPEPIQVLHPAGYQFRLDINAATWVEWMQLDRLGEKMARRIVADREENGPFLSIDDLQRVHGIGPKTLAALRPHLECASCDVTVVGNER